MGALLALLSGIVWGTADFVGGLASRRSTPLATLAISTPAGLVALAFACLVVRGDVHGSFWPGIGAGLAGAFGILFLYAALTAGPMGVVSPISAVLGAAIPVGVGLFRGERPGIPAYIGMALAVVAIITVGLEPKAPTDDSRHQRLTGRALAYSLAAGVCIGAFYTVISFAPKGSGLWPLIWARSTSSLLLIAIAFVVARRSATAMLPTEWRVRGLAVVAGVLDAGANALYLISSHLGLLSLVAVLGSLYPATTVLLARLVLAERLRLAQKIGMVTALVAAVLLALG